MKNILYCTGETLWKLVSTTQKKEKEKEKGNCNFFRGLGVVSKTKLKVYVYRISAKYPISCSP